MQYAILLIMTFLGAVASVFLKKASGQKTIISLILSRFIYIGFTLYLIAALLNVYVLQLMDYSKVLPLTSITYVWTLMLSYKVFGERIKKEKVFGVILIIIGALLVS